MLPTTPTPGIVSVFLGRPILAVVYLITIGVSVWLFRDALRRDKSVIVAAGWAVSSVVLPAIVHFAYLYLRLKSEGSVTEPPVGGPD